MIRNPSRADRRRATAIVDGLPPMFAPLQLVLTDLVKICAGVEWAFQGQVDYDPLYIALAEATQEVGSAYENVVCGYLRGQTHLEILEARFAQQNRTTRRGPLSPAIDDPDFAALVQRHAAVLDELVEYMKDQVRARRAAGRAR
ncbi:MULTISPECIES: hypothetical protein [unclassified Crossiella]|uniref:hypothetical protein n=1 Tax=unclassified Crossiella TaxID=2620835 RepID=UPI001FFE624E|nr:MULTISPECIES: hypothetical protein [unclassified Crossiella]MCK2241885.1 hypothetical protein [Crossiella sp. S99.2]MCK2255788.1 hypothetical protein [Crossiella sp. S99.1]